MLTVEDGDEEEAEQLRVGVEHERARRVDDIHGLHVPVRGYLLQEIPHLVLADGARLVVPHELRRCQRLPVNKLAGSDP